MTRTLTRTDSTPFGKWLKPVIAVALLGLLAGTAISVPGGQGQGNDRRNPNPGIIPPQAHPAGQSYGEWAAAWWQWIFSIPDDINPNHDGNDEFCGEGQDGPVWFLPGSFGGDVERSCTIPQDKLIFVPVYNWIFGASVFDCEPTAPGECDVPTLRLSAAFNTERAEAEGGLLEVTIDGVPVQNVPHYRASSPDPFPITFPENNVVGVPAGTYFPNVADGYWLMLSPLSLGEHTISLHVIAPDTDFGLLDFITITHVTIVE